MSQSSDRAKVVAEALSGDDWVKATFEAKHLLFKLASQVEKFEAFARAHQDWEGKALNSDGSWFDAMMDELEDELMEVQKLRDEAMAL